MGNQFTSFYEEIKLVEDDEILNDNDEQVEEENGTEGDDEYVQEEDWKQEATHIRKQLPPTRVERGHEMTVQRQTGLVVHAMLLHTDYRIQITKSILVNCSLF